MTTPSAAIDAPDGTRRYSIPHPDTGELFDDLPNITGIIPTPPHIYTWEQKMAILGVAFREDLQVQIVAAHLLPEGKARNTELRRLAEQARIAGQLVEKGHLANDRGSGYHALTERLDELVAPGAVALVDELGLPRSMAEIARAYVSAMAGVIVIHTEVTIVNFTHGFAGTGDRLVRFAPLDATAAAFDAYDLGRGSFWVDAKFGTVHDSVALQLAALCLGESIWDSVAGTHTILPADLRTDIGFAFHPDKGLVPVDLTGAGPAFLGALAVKKYEGAKPLRAPLAQLSTGEEASPSPAPTSPVGITDQVGGVDATAGQTVVAPHREHPPDPFAFLADEIGNIAPDRGAKRAYLIGRIQAIGADGLNEVAQRWPVIDGEPLPTFSATTEHSVAQLALIEQAVAGAERALAAPFPDVDRSEPVNLVVPNDDPTVVRLVDRLEALPPDLVAGVAAVAKIPNLRIGRVTLAHLRTLEPLIDRAEAEWRPRELHLHHSLAVAREHGVSRSVLLKALDVSAMRLIYGDVLVKFNYLVDAVVMEVVGERDGALAVIDSDILLAAHNGPAGVLKAVRTLCRQHGWRSPRSADQALADPLLAAALAAV